MGIFRRVNDIISANLNDLVDKFEEPETMLKQAIREMESTIADATAAAAKAIASERLLAREISDHERHAAEWQQRAESAVRAGDDTLARKALTRKREHDQLLRALREQLTAATGTGETLRRQIEAMRAKHAEAKRKLAALSARSKVAHARRRLHAVTPAARFSADAFSRFDRMQEKVELAEAEADALAELWTDNGHCVESRFAEHEDDLAVEAELSEIKAKLQNASPQPAGSATELDRC